MSRNRNKRKYVVIGGDGLKEIIIDDNYAAKENSQSLFNASDSESTQISIDSTDNLPNDTITTEQIGNFYSPATIPENDLVKCFVDHVFAHRFVPERPHQNFIDTNNINFNIGAIINTPEVTMANPLIGYKISDVVNKVLEAAGKIPCPRSKPLIVVLRGMGGGKTRMLSELRNNLMTSESTLTIAITYNNLTRINGELLVLTSDPRVNFVFSVIARMITAVFDVKLPLVIAAIKESIVHLKDFFNGAAAEEILRECVKHIMKTVRQFRKKDIDTLIVLIDDITHIEEELKRLFKKYSEHFDFTGSLRSALLNPVNIEKEEPFDFKVALVISTLTLSPIGASNSRRSLESIILPSQLNINQIITTWWNNSEQRSEVEKRRLQLLAACINNLPRLVEEAALFLREHHDKYIDNIFITEFIDYIIDALSSRYVTRIFPSTRLLYDIIYKIPITLNSEEVLECIQHSMLTNSVEFFLENDSIIPESNIFFLGLARVVMPTIESIVMKEAFNNVLNILKNVQDEGGYILEEDYFFFWLKLRFQIALINTKVTRTTLSLSQLFGFHLIVLQKFPKKIRALFNESIPMNFEIGDVNSLFKMDRFQASSYDVNVETFIDEIVNLNNYECRLSASRDAFDGVYKFYSVVNNTPLYIFWDDKSPPLTSTEFNNNLHQYYHIKNIMDNRNLQFIFLYVTTYPGQSDYLFDDCWLLKDDVTGRFFGPIWNLFQASRSSMEICPK